MFRIEVIPFDSKTNLASIETYYACLNTCYTDDKYQYPHVVATIGRKNNDITFGKDKCVSRCHAYLSLVHKDDDNLTSEEKNACEDDICGVSLIIEDQGSKFGTTVLQKGPVPTENDDETDDASATDDEISPANNHASLLNFENNKDNNMNQIKVKAKSPFIMHTLSSSRHKGGPRNENDVNNDSDKDQCKSTATIFFGVSGSAIRISRITFSFCFTTIDKRNFTIPTDKELQRIGAVRTSTWIISPPKNQASSDYMPPTSHLISQQFKTSAKFLTALVSQTPICTLNFIVELLKRVSMFDDLPKPQNFHPPLQSLPTSSKSTSTSTALSSRHYSLYERMKNFENNKSVDPLKKYHFILLIDDEISNLIRAAGASIHRSYDYDDTEFFNESWIKYQHEFALTKKKTIVILESSSRKVRKRQQFLQSMVENAKLNNMEQHSLHLHITNTKEVAQAVTNPNTILKDVNGISIESTSIANPMHANITENLSHDPNVHSELQSNKKYQLIQTNDEQDQHASSLTSNLQRIKRKKCARMKDNNQIDSDSGWTTKNSISSQSLSERSIQRKRSRRSVNNERLPNAMNEINCKKTKPSSLDKVDIEETSNRLTLNDSNNNNTSFDEHKNQPANVECEQKKRFMLPKTKDGWLVAAPSDPKTRSKYKRKNIQIHVISTSKDSDCDEKFEPNNFKSLGASIMMEAMAAETVIKSDLIIASWRENNNDTDLPQNHRKSTSKDFKRFRKNRVSKAHPSINITFTSVLPSESERELQLQLSQAQMENEQRIADALFTDDRGSKSRKVGRGGIMQYLSPTSSVMSDTRRSRRRVGNG